jgi:hypothetical protein
MGVRNANFEEIENSLGVGADTANAQTFDAAPPGTPSCSPKTAIFQKNYEFMVETDRGRSMR